MIAYEMSDWHLDHGNSPGAAEKKRRPVTLSVSGSRSSLYRLPDGTPIHGRVALSIRDDHNDVYSSGKTLRLRLTAEEARLLAYALLRDAAFADDDTVTFDKIVKDGEATVAVRRK